MHIETLCIGEFLGSVIGINRHPVGASVANWKPKVWQTNYEKFKKCVEHMVYEREM